MTDPVLAYTLTFQQRKLVDVYTNGDFFLNLDGVTHLVQQAAAANDARVRPISTSSAPLFVPDGEPWLSDQEANIREFVANNGLHVSDPEPRFGHAGFQVKFLRDAELPPEVFHFSLAERDVLTTATEYAVIHAAAQRTFVVDGQSRRFVVAIVGARGKVGAWIHPQDNGVAVLDVDRGQVLADQLHPCDYGLDRPSPFQLARYAFFLRCPWSGFQWFINRCGRNRYTI